MAKKINFGTINAQALTALNNWNYVDLNGREVRKTAQAQINSAQKKIDDILALRADAVAQGMPIDEAVQKYSTVEAQASLLKAQDDQKETAKGLREKQNEAKALVPVDLYKAYTVKNTTGDSAPFVAGITEFLATLGINTPEVATEKFAETLAVRLGRGKATGGNKKDGHKTQDLKEKSFADMVISEFLEFLIFDKGVLDQAQDGTLSYHNFSKDNAEEKKEEVAA